MNDARFEDGDERPLNLGALDADDLGVIAALVQDAVLTATDMTYDRRARRFAMLLNRYRWEVDGAGRTERVRSLLVIEDVTRVRTSGFDRHDADMVLSVLDIGFEEAEDGAGTLTVTLAGDGAVALDVECIDVRLRDVTRPYRAVSRKRPDHGLDDDS